MRRKCYESFAGGVREAAEAGRLRTDDGEDAAQTMWMAGHGVVALLISRRGLFVD